jgi:hypothetical protein
MYTKRYDEADKTWGVYCPEDLRLVTVDFEHQADVLLSHLNRG